MLVFPEGGRTWGAHTAANELVDYNGRCMRKVQTGIAYKLVSQTRGRVLPIYVSMEGVNQPVGLFSALFKVWTTTNLCVHVGHAYTPSTKGEEAFDEQQIKILTA